MKQVRDRHARDEYAYDEGLAAGEAIGEARGEERGRSEGRLGAENSMQTLIARMVEAGEGDKLSQLSDKRFYEEMLRKYGL